MRARSFQTHGLRPPPPPPHTHTRIERHKCTSPPSPASCGLARCNRAVGMHWQAGISDEPDSFKVLVQA